MTDLPREEPTKDMLPIEAMQFGQKIAPRIIGLFSENRKVSFEEVLDLFREKLSMEDIQLLMDKRIEDLSGNLGDILLDYITNYNAFYIEAEKIFEVKNMDRFVRFALEQSMPRTLKEIFEEKSQASQNEIESTDPTIISKLEELIAEVQELRTQVAAQTKEIQELK